VRKSRFTEEQIVGILQEYSAGAKVSELCRKHGISDVALYKWKAKYGGMTVSELRRFMVVGLLPKAPRKANGNLAVASADIAPSISTAFMPGSLDPAKGCWGSVTQCLQMMHWEKCQTISGVGEQSGSHHSSGSMSVSPSSLMPNRATGWCLMR